MKICNETEKVLINENRASILKGKNKINTYAGYGALLFGLFIWMIIMFSSIFFVVDIFSDTVFYIWIIFLLIISRFIVDFFTCKIKIFRQNKQTLTNKDIRINGATIIKADQQIKTGVSIY